MTFNSDGTATSGVERWTWTLAGDTLTLTRDGGTPEIYTLSRSGPDFVMTHGGAALTMSPCPPGSGAIR